LRNEKFNHTATWIADRINTILKVGVRVKLQWIPSHTFENKNKKISEISKNIINKAKENFPGSWDLFIKGNTEVDLLAKQGVKLIATNPPLPYNAPATIIYFKETPILQNISKTIRIYFTSLKG